MCKSRFRFALFLSQQKLHWELEILFCSIKKLSLIKKSESKSKESLQHLNTIQLLVHLNIQPQEAFKRSDDTSILKNVRVHESIGREEKQGLPEVRH